MTRSNRTRLRAGLLMISAALAAPALHAQTLLNVSYDPTRELYEDYNAAFAKHWKAKGGKAVTVEAVARRLGQAGADGRSTASPRTSSRSRSPRTSTRS